jgi:ATP diphosphatase
VGVDVQELKRLLEIMRALRDPETGCPWDIEQDFKSISAYTIEEAYEVADAIERNDMHDLKDELGDLLFQVVFHSQMADEHSDFCFTDVVEAINDKLVRRHPHVFAGESREDKAQLNEAWEQHKKKERDEKGISKSSAVTESALAHVATTLPALRWSEKLQKKAARAGFDWDELPPVYAKLEEELDELRHEVDIENNHDRISEEMGDLLFSCVNLSRHLDVNPEQALRDANRKFISRFTVVEQLVLKDGKTMDDCTIEELEAYWQKAKEVARD